HFALCILHFALCIPRPLVPPNRTIVMRIERWYWLGVFCLVSFLIHLGVVWNSPGLGLPAPPPKPAEIEVALQAPAEEAKPAPKPPPPTPKPKISEKHNPEPPT